MCRTRLSLALLVVLAGNGLAAANPAADESLKGQRIYRDGILPSGAALRATVQQEVVLSGGDAACAKCHRRSGLGGSEGQNAIRPIAGRLLFSRPELSGSERVRALFRVNDARPPYTVASLARALRKGIDPAGRKLDPLMPRFALGDAEIAQLASYLQGLSVEPAPGVTNSEIHFATIIAPDVSPSRAQAMLGVLRTFFRDKNGGTRQEDRRKSVGTEQMYRVYRKWVLHEWVLSGSAETWHEQLAAYYRQQPVFAVLSGIGAGSWRPVHEFCERSEIPCLFPNVDYPELAQSGYETLYFSRGVALEAEVLAQHLGESGQAGRIVQVFRDNDAGRVPAQTLRAALQRRGIHDVADRPLPGGEPVPGAFCAQLASETVAEVLILWLSDDDLGTLFSQCSAQPSGVGNLYLSGSLTEQPGKLLLPDSWQQRVRLVYPFELAERRAQRLSRMKHWLASKNIPQLDERVQSGAYFAVTIAGDALALMGNNFSRDYFIERVEQMTENSLASSVYPHLSLAAGQRFASRGGYVARFTEDGEHMLVPASAWIVP
ncbi:MAG: ABC transporter substrate-binding protein [Gallionellaceae bacterium]|jgi:mono/diheme cytochrome c family protein